MFMTDLLVHFTFRNLHGKSLGVLCVDGNRKLDSLKRQGSDDPSRGQNLSALVGDPDHQLWPETEPEEIIEPSEEAKKAALAMNHQSKSQCALNFKVGSAKEQDRRPFIDDVLRLIVFFSVDHLFYCSVASRTPISASLPLKCFCS